MHNVILIVFFAKNAISRGLETAKIKHFPGAAPKLRRLLRNLLFSGLHICFFFVCFFHFIFFFLNTFLCHFYCASVLSCKIKWKKWSRGTFWGHSSNIKITKIFTFLSVGFSWLLNMLICRAAHRKFAVASPLHVYYLWTQYVINS